jgi:YbgC/YbaW family acyl-CoA thioester hydrolase
MSTFDRQPESTLKVRFHDCDPFNHLHNSRYIDYMMAARNEQLLTHYDFDMFASAKTIGLSWVFAETQIAYLVPAKLSETILVQTRLMSFGQKTIVLEALMYDEKKTTLKSIMRSTLVHFDLRQQKSTTHSKELRDFFEPIVLSFESDVNFEQRVKQLKGIL